MRFARSALTLAFGLAVALSACVDAPPSGPEGRALTDAERADCLMRGGTVGRGGLLPDEICFLPLADGGKACSKKTDCEGMCVVDPVSRAASCAKVTPQFGCFDFLDETGQELGICVD
jgi:hypothetical protein